MTAVYRNRSVRIHEDSPFFAYFDVLTKNANNLHNAIRFRQRQVMTAVKKPESDWSANEREIMDEIRNVLPLMKHGFEPSEKKHQLPYCFLDELMKLTDNPDYRRTGFPSQTAQQTIMLACREMKSFFASLRQWKKNPSSFNGRPELPGYGRKGGHYTAVITNQQSKLLLVDGRWKLQLPLPPLELKDMTLDFGIADDSSLVLKETKVVYDNGTFVVNVTLQKEMGIKVNDFSSRMASIDFGVDNLMSVVNNCGLPSLLYKGGIVKSVNQNYNRRLSLLMSKQMTKTGGKFHATPESQRITRYRNDFISDYMHKTARHLITWCVENRIDTLVCGVNKGWKQESELGKVNNQNFVQIPFASLRGILKYLCEENGIAYKEQEESYTSKASFLDGDDIPVYGKTETEPTFSGRRRPTRYKGMYKSGGFRGLYTASDGAVINSDLNGAANILKKAFPDAFKEQNSDFTNVVIIRHPDEDKIKANRLKQLTERAVKAA